MYLLTLYIYIFHFVICFAQFHLHFSFCITLISKLIHIHLTLLGERIELTMKYCLCIFCGSSQIILNKSALIYFSRTIIQVQLYKQFPKICFIYANSRRSFASSTYLSRSSCYRQVMNRGHLLYSLILLI